MSAVTKILQLIEDDKMPRHVREFLRTSLRRHHYVAWYDAEKIADALRERYQADPDGTMENSAKDIQQLIDDGSQPRYIRDFLRTSLGRHPYEAWYDAESMAGMLHERYREKQEDRG